MWQPPNEFVRVSKEVPCPICGHDKWCTIWYNGTVACCPRVANDRANLTWGYSHILEMPIDVSRCHRVNDDTADIDWGQLAKYYQQEYEQMPWTTPRLFSEDNEIIASCAAFGVGWDGKAYTIPMWKSGQVCGIQRRFPNGEKSSVTGSHRGLFLPRTTWDTIENVSVCEGASDAIYLWTQGASHYVIGRQNCDMTDDVIDFIRFAQPKTVVIFADNDEPGISGARTLQFDIPGSRVFVPLEKDVRETITKHGILEGRWL